LEDRQTIDRLSIAAWTICEDRGYLEVRFCH